MIDEGQSTASKAKATSMKVYLGLLESSRPDQTKIFGAIDGKLVDLNLAYAACLRHSKNSQANAYELAAFTFPGSIEAILERGKTSREALDDVVEFARKNGVGEVRGPTGERVCYAAKEIRLLPPFLTPEKSFVIGFSDKVRTEALPKADAAGADDSWRAEWPSLVLGVDGRAPCDASRGSSGHERSEVGGCRGRRRSRNEPQCAS